MLPGLWIILIQKNWSLMMTNNSSENPRRLYRSRPNRIIGGICGGVAEYFAIDVTLVRIIWVITVFFNGLGLVGYIAALILMRENPEQADVPVAEKSMPKNTGLIVGIILIVLGLLFLSREFYFPFYDWHHFWVFPFKARAFWPIIIILIGVFYIIYILRQDQKPSEGEFGSVPSEKAAPGPKIYRSRRERMIGGICGGLAAFWNIDPTLVRIGYALLTFFTGVVLGILVYIILMIAIPEEE